MIHKTRLDHKKLINFIVCIICPNNIQCMNHRHIKHRTMKNYDINGLFLNQHDDTIECSKEA